MTFHHMPISALFSRFFLSLLLLLHASASDATDSRCRAQPGDPGFPNQEELGVFNTSVDGRLLKIVPSGEFCMMRPGGCPDSEWFNGNFRVDIPGAMLTVNWEEDYSSNPPSLCFRNSSVCGQGNVPVYGVNATTAEHIQASVSPSPIAAVKFAKTFNLKVAIKASGHDILGRSTAKNSFLIWTRHLQNVTFHDTFTVGNTNLSSAVTVGSGVGLHKLYQLTKKEGKVFVGGLAASVVASGGYVQGGGHSALSPTFGLAAENVLQFEIVIADGTLLTVNQDSYSDLFWALRGGGAGSWGVIISTTFKTYDTFNVVQHIIFITANSTDQVANLNEIHARHIFDWDDLHAGQYFGCVFIEQPATFQLSIETYFPNQTIEIANRSLTPFVEDLYRAGYSPDSISAKIILVNDALGVETEDDAGIGLVLGSRLFPESLYKENVTEIKNTYKKLFDGGALLYVRERIRADSPRKANISDRIQGVLLGGAIGKRSNDSALHPAWKTSKAHIFVAATWDEATGPAEALAIQKDITENKVPILAAITGGPDSASYSNEADVQEPHFQTTFFGSNYPRLLRVKLKYDPDFMFIVPVGVGSEYFDVEGLCLL